MHAIERRLRASARPPGPPPHALARRYLDHAAPAGRPAAATVELEMRGEIRVGRWRPFRARELLVSGRGFLWRARAGLVTVLDHYCEGAGGTEVRLLRLLPLGRERGPDIARSAFGRYAAELVWLPHALAAGRWEPRPGGARVRIEDAAHAADLDVDLDGSGALTSVGLARWGNPDGEGWRARPFGALVEDETTFDGLRIPARVRVGWHFGTERFDEGEFFRATVTAARFGAR